MTGKNDHISDYPTNIYPDTWNNNSPVENDDFMEHVNAARVNCTANDTTLAQGGGALSENGCE